jgi:hypothetical protein
MLIVPSRKLIAVRSGGQLAPGNDGFESMQNYLAKPLMEAIDDLAPYPRSDIIRQVEWAPICQITRMATGGPKRDGSDNWPMTWGDDDHLYTAYGDGYGFKPALPTKRGLGFARVEGEATDFRPFNIRSDAENGGYGPAAPKASGLLMVDGILYMWTRNAVKGGTQSRLARSDDYAKTWQWADWKFAEFGHIAFINFGENYAGSRDDYVYMVSHDHPSAYTFSDRFILMHVLKDRITERDAYEFFVGTNDTHHPEWSSDAKERGAVFTHKHQCLRSSVSYHPGIQRYLWWQSFSSQRGRIKLEGIKKR